MVFRNFSASCSVNFVAKYLCTCYKLQAHNDNGNDNKNFTGKWLNNNLLVFRSWCKRGKRRFLYTSANNKYCCAHQILLPTFCQIFFIDTNPDAYLNSDKYQHVDKSYKRIKILITTMQLSALFCSTLVPKKRCESRSHVHYFYFLLICLTHSLLLATDQKEKFSNLISKADSEKRQTVSQR